MENQPLSMLFSIIIKGVKLEDNFRFLLINEPDKEGG